MSRGTFLGFFFHLDRSYCGTERITNLVTWIYKCEGRNAAECVGLQARAQKRIYLLCYVCSIPSFVSSLLTYFFPFVEKKVGSCRSNAVFLARGGTQNLS